MILFTPLDIPKIQPNNWDEWWEFWNNEIRTIIADFKQHNFVDGICHMIEDVGNALKLNFPYTSDDKNELSDGIVFGK